MLGAPDCALDVEIVTMRPLAASMSGGGLHAREGAGEVDAMIRSQVSA